MRFDIRFVAGADDDLGFYRPREQRIILDGGAEFLGVDADVESKRRKRLRPNPLAPWVLRIGDYRVFYELQESALVRVLSVGHKVHNDLFIRGTRAEI